MKNDNLTPLQRTQREHDKNRSEARKGTVEQVRFANADERKLFKSLLSQSRTETGEKETAVGILRAWMSAKLVV